jgi:outer membrane receptor for ferrienterochelin and colicins
MRANYDRKYQIEAGVTIQESKYDSDIEWSAEIPGSRDFLRTPSVYGFYTLSIMPNDAFNATISGIYTGSMKVPHYAGAPGVENDELIDSDPFNEVNLKIGYAFKIPNSDQKIQLFAGMQNIFNQYQNNFDTGKNRDSGFIYGPAKPRTYFLGIKIGSF